MYYIVKRSTNGVVTQWDMCRVNFMFVLEIGSEWTVGFGWGKKKIFAIVL